MELRQEKIIITDIIKIIINRHIEGGRERKTRRKRRKRRRKRTELQKPITTTPS